MASYHGSQPVSESDVKMAKKHLKETYKLNKQKIKDHKKAMKSADDPKSASYNQTHMKGHMQDNSQIKKSMNTLMSQINNNARSSNGNN